MQILVTGGVGFIGANLCLSLLKQRHEVIAIDNLITSDGSNLKVLKKYPRFSFIKHDIINPLPKKLTADSFQLTAVYHLACPTGVPNLIPLAEEMLLTCSIGTFNILDLARLHKSKILFTSSSEVYGDPKVSPQSENYTGNVDSIGIRSPYEEGKRFAESLVTAYARIYKLDAKIVRIFNTYGPAMAKNDTRVIPRFLQLASTNQPLTVHGNGQQKRTFCYVDDLIGGLITVMNKGKTGEVYNIGNDEQVTIVQLARLIVKLTKSRSKIVYVKRPSHDHQSRIPDLSKVKSLGWIPQTSLTTGLKLTLNTM